MDIPRSTHEITPNGADRLAQLPIPAELMREQVREIQALMKLVMREGEHYGHVAGSRKPSLWKSGAEKLSVAFHVAPSYEIEDLSTPEQARYRVRCMGTHQGTGVRLGEGFGSCSSMESRYKWRRATDEEFERTPKARRRLKYGYDREKARPYEMKQVRADHEDVENTILKMACKRAHVAMVLNVTAASDIFTQDLEEMPELEERVEQPSLAAIREPQRRSGSAMEGQAPDKLGKQEDKRPLSTGQRRVLRASIKQSGANEAALIEKFDVGTSAVTRGQLKDILAWLRSPKSDAQPVQA